MEQIKQKDKFKVFSIIAAVLFAFVGLSNILIYNLEAFINMLRGLALNFFTDGFYGMITGIPLLISAALLIFKKKSWLIYIPIGFSAISFCGFIIFRVYYPILVNLVAYTPSAVVMFYDCIFAMIGTVIIAAIVILLGFLLRNKPCIPMFVLSGVTAFNIFVRILNVFNSFRYYNWFSLLMQIVFVLIGYVLIAAFILAGIGMISSKNKSKIALAAEIAMADELDGGMKIDGDRNIEIDNAAIYEERSEETPVFQQVYAPQEDRFVAPEPEFKPLQQEYVAPEPEFKPIQQEYVAPASAPVTGEIKLGVADEILKFEDLYKRGVITREQFEAKKNQLLGM